MKARALASFSGVIAMAAGEVREITDPSISSDLLRAGYIEDLDEAERQAKKTSAKKKKGEKE